MNILLVRVVDHSTSRVVFFPLGLLYLAAYVEEQIPQAQIKILDTQLCENPRRELDRLTKGWIPDVIGLSGLSVDKRELHSMLGLIRSRFAKARTVVGGNYASAQPADVLSDKSVDYCIVGEGERSFCLLLQELLRGEDISKDNCRFSRDRLVNQGRPLPVAVDELPYPAYHLIDVESYFGARPRRVHFPFRQHERSMPVMLSRGCVYSCKFCHNVFGKKVRYRSVNKVMEEIHILRVRYGAEEIAVTDDCFNADLDTAKAFMREIAKMDPGLAVNLLGIRADRVDEELADLFKKAGVYHVGIGVESGSQDILKSMGKNLCLERVRQTADLLIRNRIATTGFFMFGFPGEKVEDVIRTTQFAMESSLVFAVASFVTPFPGTRLYEELLDEKSKESEVTRNEYEGNPYISLQVNLSNISDTELIRLKRAFTLKFHFSFRRMAIMARALGFFRMCRAVLKYFPLALRYIAGRELSEQQ